MDLTTDLTAAEAAAALGISRASLYAYVSRGLIRSRPSPDDPRARRYYREDIARLRAQQEQRSTPERIAATVLDWGAPVLESQLTLISDGRLYYRGHDAVALARSRSIEQVAQLLWLGALPDQAPGFAPLPADLPAPAAPGLTPLLRFQASLPLLAAQDEAGYDTRPAAVVRSGGRILRLLAGLLTPDDQQRLTPDPSPPPPPLAAQIQQALAPGEARLVGLFDAALILCADHELNVSAFTARCVASAGASPYDVVSAGMSALAGVRHGGQTERVAALLREVERPEQARPALAERLRRGDPIPGFGHRLYPAGDPRGRALLDMVAAALPDAPAVARGQALLDAAHALLDERPTIDFALAVLGQALAAPGGTALALFALGRTVGWLAHAIEEYALGRLIRPRATYSGPPPGTG